MPITSEGYAPQGIPHLFTSQDTASKILILLEEVDKKDIPKKLSVVFGRHVSEFDLLLEVLQIY